MGMGWELNKVRVRTLGWRWGGRFSIQGVLSPSLRPRRGRAGLVKDGGVENRESLRFSGFLLGPKKGSRGPAHPTQL
jgi:hypothetical protein